MIFPVIAFDVALVDVNALISPEFEAPKPIYVLSLVQEYIVP